MITSFNICLCKMITTVCKLFKRDGSVFPGSIIYKLQKNILDKIVFPKEVVVVTGSSGKGSTVNMISHILTNSGKKVVWNKNGSNINNAIMTLVLNNTNIFTHKVNADVLLLEMDERFITKTFKKGIITTLLITNVTRDQPSRNYDSNFIFYEIAASFHNKMKIIINDDDPLLNRVKYIHRGKIITYGIDKTKYDSKKITYPIDSAYCPRCLSKLHYEYYHYGHFGNYFCPICDFKRGQLDYIATNVNYKTKEMKINDNLVNLNKGVFFSVYYTLAAYACTSEIGVNKKDIIYNLTDNLPASKRGKVKTLENRNIEMIESKNENALSYLQSLTYIVNKPEKKSIIMGFENVSRRYSYNDLSWLWDVDFELLNNSKVEKIFLIGRFKLDVLTRLIYAGIDESKIVLVEDLNNLLEIVLKESTSDIYTMVCFDMTAEINRLLKERNDEKR